MAGNQQIPDLPAVPSPDGGDVYIVKDDTDYRVPVGEALGLATLNSDGVLSVDQRPEAEIVTGSLIAGTGVSFTGTATDRLVGSGDLTISATATGVSWGSITGTLSSQTDLNTALAGKAALSHTHSASDITSGTFSTARLGSGSATSGTFLRGDGSWQAVSTGSANWGSISGTLSSQTDLQTALNAKASTSHTHAASDITSGTMATARLGSGTASTSTFLRGDNTWQSVGGTWGSITGTLSAQTDLQTALNGKASTTHTHAASDITSGTMATARLGSGSATSSTFLRGDGTWASTSTGAATWGSISGNLADQSDITTALAGKADSSHTHSGADIVSGTVAVARLGSGTPSASNFLRGDGSWQAVSTGTAWGGITGTLSSQTDLQSALDSKANDSDVVHDSGTETIGGTKTFTSTISGSINGNAATATNVAWSGITSKPTTLAGYGITDAASSSHTHPASDITSGTMATARLGSGTANSTVVLKGNSTWGAVAYSDLSGVPSSFTPAAHVHDGADITTGSIGLARLGALTPTSSTFLNGDGIWRAVEWDDVVLKPTTFTPASHTHTTADITSGTFADARLSSNVPLKNAANTFTANQTAPDWIATSDARLKYDIHDAEPRQRLADLLRFVSFIYTATDEERLGLIAQEVLEVAPEYVIVGENGYLGIDKAGIALEAVIGLAKRVHELENTVY